MREKILVLGTTLLPVELAWLTGALLHMLKCYDWVVYFWLIDHSVDWVVNQPKVWTEPLGPDSDEWFSQLYPRWTHQLKQAH